EASRGREPRVNSTTSETLLSRGAYPGSPFSCVRSGVLGIVEFPRGAYAPPLAFSIRLPARLLLQTLVARGQGSPPGQVGLCLLHDPQSLRPVAFPQSSLADAEKQFQATFTHRLLCLQEYQIADQRCCQG